MLKYSEVLDCVGMVGINGNDKANAQDSEILTHARGLMEIRRAIDVSLRETFDVLQTRKTYIDNVMTAIADILVDDHVPASDTASL
jgi:hypothetical protein